PGARRSPRASPAEGHPSPRVRPEMAIQPGAPRARRLARRGAGGDVRCVACARSASARHPVRRRHLRCRAVECATVRSRPRVAGFDACLSFVLMVAAIVLTWGGGTLFVAGLRISAQRGWKPIAWVAVALTLRFWWYGRSAPFGRSWRDVARATGWI